MANEARVRAVKAVEAIFERYAYFEIESVDSAHL